MLIVIHILCTKTARYDDLNEGLIPVILSNTIPYHQVCNCQASQR